jgi:hypothetical protein
LENIALARETIAIVLENIALARETIALARETIALARGDDRARAAAQRYRPGLTGRAGT